MSDFDRMRVGAVKTLIEGGWRWEQGKWVGPVVGKGPAGFGQMDQAALRLLADAHTVTDKTHPDGFQIIIGTNRITNVRDYVNSWAEVRRALGIE